MGPPDVFFCPHILSDQAGFDSLSFFPVIKNNDHDKISDKCNLLFSATKQEKLLQKRYAEFLKYPAVTKTITLPLLVPSVHGQSKSELSFSVSDGMKWKVCKRHCLFYLKMKINI